MSRPAARQDPAAGEATSGAGDDRPRGRDDLSGSAARRGHLTELQEAINRYIEEHNNDPKPFVWTKSSQTILENTTEYLYLPFESVH